MARRLSAATRSRALDALSLHREAEREGFHLTLQEAARERHSSVRSMRRVAGRDAIRKVRGEWTYAPRKDEAVRKTTILHRTPEGAERAYVRVRGLDQTSKAGGYWKALQDGDWRAIQGFKGSYVTDTYGRRHYFETNRATLRQLDREGELRGEGLQFT